MTHQLFTLIIAIHFSLISIFSQAGTAFAAPTYLKTGLTVPDSLGKAYSGYTLYSVKHGDQVIAIHMDGTVANTWKIPGVGPVAKPLSNGHILALYGEPGTNTAHTVAEFDWDGNEVWKYKNTEFQDLHHDFHRLPNGNTLILATRPRTVLTITKNEIKDNVILEITPSGETVWQWSTADHYDQLALAPEVKELILNGNFNDLFHTNSIQALPQNRFMASDSRLKMGNILVSQRRTNLVFIIDKATQNIIWTLGKSTIGQHHARMIPQGLPGAGNILLFDNGGEYGIPPVTRFFSIVWELHPLRSFKVWAYTANMSDNQDRLNFFSIVRSGCQRLPNGNTLITESSRGRIFEVNPAGEILWEYISPIFRYEKDGIHTNLTNEIYRAYRVDEAWRTGEVKDFTW